MQARLRTLFILIFFILILLTLYLLSIRPSYTGKIEIPGIDSDVIAYFDDFGIPHIEAETELDGYKAFGYIIAQDRLFQMDLLRRLISGRLSEVFGAVTKDQDIMLRNFLFKKTALENLEKMQADPSMAHILSVMDSYLAGIQHFIDTRPLPPEFKLLGYKPEAFDKADILGIGAYMTLTFAEGIKSDFIIDKLLRKLPKDQREILNTGGDVDFDYFPEAKTVKTSIIKELMNTVEGLAKILPMFHGSNSWVLSGKRTVSGHAVLANDPHMGVSNPHVFYEAHLKVKGFEITGHYIPLMPFAVLGATPYSAWGLTMAMIDDVNIYQEKINPDDESLVMFKGEWVALVDSQEEIKIKDEESVLIKISKTPHGPIISNESAGRVAGHYSINWSVYNPENNIAKTLYYLGYAKTVTEFKQSLSHAAGPAINVSWINKQGDIAWWVLGKFPKFKNKIKTNQILKGWDGSSEVESYTKIDENPHQVNPESGIIITANYKPQLEEFKHFFGYWQPSGRYFRLEKLLKQKEVWSNEELLKFQNDTIVPIEAQFKTLVVSKIDDVRLSPLELKVLKILQDWDGNTDIKSLGASVYFSLNYFITQEALLDDFGKEDLDIFESVGALWNVYKALLQNADHGLWDNLETREIESSEDIINIAFSKSVADLASRLGKNPQKWRWGKLHTIEYEHPLGKIKPLNYLFNIGPIETNGGRFVINNKGHYRHLNDYRVIHAPATRRLVDMADYKMSKTIIPTGNSGNLLSPHYKDQVSLYQEGHYRTQLMDWDIIKKEKPLIFKSGQ